MHGGDLKRVLENLVPFGPSRIVETASTLRSAGLLPLRGHGPHAAQLDVQHVANVLLGLNAPTAAKAADFVIDWNRMTPNDRGGHGFSGAASFGGAIAIILDDDAYRLEVAEIVINIDWPQAAIHLVDGRKFEFGSSEDAKRRGYAVTPSNRSFHITGGVLHQLAIDLKEDPDADHGWVGDAE